MREYTVCFPFTDDLSQVVLVRKIRTAFACKLNGPGGELENGETPYQCAAREILEETDLGADDFHGLPDGRYLVHLGTLSLPHDCKYGTDDGCVLHYFAGRLVHDAEKRAKGHPEPAELRPVTDAERSGTDGHIYAGDGDLAYFIKAGRRALAGIWPDAACDERERTVMPELAAARGAMDACFRRGDLRGAAEEASRVAMLSYAAWRNREVGNNA